jgi:uncharacterized protein (TIGR02099 family)
LYVDRLISDAARPRAEPDTFLLHIEHSIAELVPPPQSRWWTLARILGWTATVVYLLFALTVLALRYWVLPTVRTHTDLIERKVSQALGERVTIGTIDAGWQGLRPRLRLSNVTVYDRSGRPALSLPAVEAVVSWLTAVHGSPRFYSLVLDRPNLEIRRDAAGKLYVAGIELDPEGAGQSGIADWILAQREIVISNAALTWDDELRKAPKLSLPQLSFLMHSGFNTHSFALRAKPAPELASTLDLRGELHGDDLHDLASWSGRLYAELEYTDLAAWQQWIDYPVEFDSGKGGVRMWLDFDGEHLTNLTADVALAGVTTRLAKDLPLLRLSSLQGRLGAKAIGDGFEASGEQLSLRTDDGIAVEPTDFALLWQPVSLMRPERIEFSTTKLRLEQVVRLAEYLPLRAEMRSRLAALDPRGSVFDVKLSRTGGGDHPERYTVHGRFVSLGVRSYERLPGFAGLSGNVDASETGGSLTLASQQVVVQLPGILVENEARLDRLNASLEWKLGQDRLELRMRNISIANPDLVGNLSGSFQSKSGRRFLDLTGNFSRVNGRGVYRYIPELPENVAEYLKRAVQAATSDDVRLRIKGDLSEFPFPEPKQGLFHIVAKLKATKFRFGSDWPELSDFSGELEFDRRSMRVTESRATIQGVRLRNTRAVIPDLFNGNEHLRVEGEAEDQTAAFLRFIETTPVRDMIEGFTSGMRASGNGRLQLRLDLPLRRPEESKLAGSFEFLGNQIRLDDRLPPFSQVKGRLEFSEAGVNARSITGQFLGGPMTLALATRDRVTTANASGTALVTGLPPAWAKAFSKRVTGSTAWKAIISGGQGKASTLLVESQLTGLAIDLPEPFSKRPPEAMPLRFERITGPEGQGGRRNDVIKLTLGRAVDAQILGRKQGDQYTLDRGVIAFSEPAVLPSQRGLFVTGSLPHLDVDTWRSLISGDDAASGDFKPTLVDLRIAILDFSGKRVHDLALRARPARNDNSWTINVSAKELAGNISWRPEGSGKLTARLDRFIVPDNVPGSEPEETAPVREMPALDIVAESFTLRGMNLGRLELLAANEEGQNWRVEKLTLGNEDGTLKADGVWENWQDTPAVNINIEIKVNDIGKFMERLGYPKAVNKGRATLTGRIGWAGGPTSVDIPTLAGELKFLAENGQFLKIDPGAAKLIGVLSMQSLVTFDFRNTFAKGFAFRSVSGSVTIANGVLNTEDFLMVGPSARVSMRGTIDLVRETEDVRIRVVPSLGDTAAWIPAIMVNPFWGPIALVLQRVLKDPLGQIFAFEYRASGLWTKPQVEPIRAEVQKSETRFPPSP